jgi:hypothetical protein
MSIQLMGHPVVDPTADRTTSFDWQPEPILCQFEASVEANSCASIECSELDHSCFTGRWTSIPKEALRQMFTGSRQKREGWLWG